MISRVEFPELTDVRGATNLQSTEDIGDICSTFQELKSDRVIKGKLTCTQTGNPQGQGSNGGGSGGSSGSDDSNSENSASRAVSGATGVLGVMAVIFAML